MITLAVGLAVGVPLGAWLRLRLLCSPTCRKHGVWLWTPAQEDAAWERGVTVRDAWEHGELTATRVGERVRVLLAGRRERITETDEPVPTVAA